MMETIGKRLHIAQRHLPSVPVVVSPEYARYGLYTVYILLLHVIYINNMCYIHNNIL